jgi:hypothetical protein
MNGWMAGAAPGQSKFGIAEQHKGSKFSQFYKQQDYEEDEQDFAEKQPALLLGQE